MQTTQTTRQSAATARQDLLEQIRTVSPQRFASVALQVFRYQATHNSTYARYLDLLRVDPTAVTNLTDIPHLPISLFKTQNLQSGGWEATRTFTSSGTTGATTSHHPLRDETWYRSLARQTFESQYGPLKNRPVLALLPAYLERSGSSLVFMVDDFVRNSRHPDSGFFLNDLAGLATRIEKLRNTQPAPLLIGVSFALLDLAERFPTPAGNFIIMETGGMKGRRQELTRPELHQQLGQAFEVAHIHSEYGMTELLSQAYAPHNGIFHPANTLRVTTREITDPFTTTPIGRTGTLDLTDLANLDTISFIKSDDLGRAHPEGTFEVLGRLDASDIRGCNLLVL